MNTATSTVVVVYIGLKDLQKNDALNNKIQIP